MNDKLKIIWSIVLGVCLVLFIGGCVAVEIIYALEGTPWWER